MPKVLRWLSTKLNCSSQTANLLAATAGGDVEVVKGVRHNFLMETLQSLEGNNVNLHAMRGGRYCISIKTGTDRKEIEDSFPQN